MEEQTDLLKEIELLRLEIDRYKPYYTKYLQILKREELKAHGLTDDYWINKVSGEDEATIIANVQTLATELKLEERGKPVDPSNLGNGRKSLPQVKTLEDVGRDTFKELASKGKIKGVNGRNYGNGAIRNSVTIPDEPQPVQKATDTTKGIITKWRKRLTGGH